MTEHDGLHQLGNFRLFFDTSALSSNERDLFLDHSDIYFDYVAIKSLMYIAESSPEGERLRDDALSMMNGRRTGRIPSLIVVTDYVDTNELTTNIVMMGEVTTVDEALRISTALKSRRERKEAMVSHRHLRRRFLPSLRPSMFKVPKGLGVDHQFVPLLL